MLILLAEDDAELRFILSRVLKNDGFEVEEVGDYHALFARLEHYAGLSQKARREVVLVSDVYMPGGTALSAVATLREPLDGMSLIFMTSAKDDDITAHGMRLGAAAVLSKPVDMDELKRIIRGTIDIV